jgi:hypothetical protein
MLNKDGMQELHKEISNKAQALMASKSHDYATDADPLRNFRDFGSFGVVVRLYDKLARLRSFEEQKELHVKDETILDSVIDICNYAIIYYALYQEKIAPQQEIVMDDKLQNAVVNIGKLFENADYEAMEVALEANDIVGLAAALKVSSEALPDIIDFFREVARDLFVRCVTLDTTGKSC